MYKIIMYQNKTIVHIVGLIILTDNMILII